MFDHVHRTVIAGNAIATGGDASDSLVARLRPAGLERYTGLIVYATEFHLAVLEGPAPLHTLHRHALQLAGLRSARTLLMQRTTFRWFSALVFEQHDAPPPGFSLAELEQLAMMSPRRLCHHIAGLAHLGQRQSLPLATVPADLTQVH